jgi:hypothetical protein
MILNQTMHGTNIKLKLASFGEVLLHHSSGAEQNVSVNFCIWQWPSALGLAVAS